MIDYKMYFAFWIFIMSLCIGSFLNVVILRGLSGESIVFPPSKCPKCGNKLQWWMNIPVLSYILLRGKCHCCKEKISVQYPIIELFTGILFLLIYLKFSLSITTLFFIIASALLIVMSVCDIKENVILDFHSYILVFFGILYHIVSKTHPDFLSAILFPVIGAVVGFLLYEIIARSGYIFAGQRAFGEGDSLIAAGIGAFFGWKFVIISFFISVLVMSLFTFPYFLIFSYKNGKKRTVYGLIVSICAIIASFASVKLNLTDNIYFALVFLAIIGTATIWAVKQILSDMKKKDETGEENLCVLPFGPSMAISFLIIMFYSNEIETVVKTYISQFV